MDTPLLPPIERLDAPGVAVLVRWQRVLHPCGHPAFYLDIGQDAVELYEVTNPMVVGGYSCTRQEFLDGQLHQDVVRMLDQSTLDAALAWLRAAIPSR